AGGYQYNAALPVTTQAYSVTVGAAGVAGINGGAGQGGNGGNSVFSATIAYGGGGGAYGSLSNAGSSGGSGGGGSMEGGGAGGIGFQGGKGGDGAANSAWEGGGGGAGGDGSGYTPGPGIVNSISGSAVTYGVGGSYSSGQGDRTEKGSGGMGSSPSGNGKVGVIGIVIISYVTADFSAYTVTGGTITTSGANTIHTFTSNGTFSVTGLPTVTSPTATSITPTGVTLGANVTSNGGITLTAKGTCWATTATPTTNCTAEGGTTTGVFTQARSGMPPGTLIYYRGYATNSIGTSYSADGSFTTSLAAPTTTAINPTSGINNAPVSIISVSGTNFISGATVSLLKSGQTTINCTGFIFTNSTTLSNGTCPITGAANGAWDVRVTNPDTQTGTFSGGFIIGVLTTGSLISSTYDTGFTKGVNHNSLMWQGALGTGGTNYVTFQFAASNCPGGQTNAPTCNTGAWTYLGPGGSTGTYYTTSGPNSPVPLNGAYSKGTRYYRYKVILQKVDTATSPRVDDVIVNWSP
ncbi:MAG: glycine-rich domain-containing protein, partial [Patescibacteria group bacterium]